MHHYINAKRCCFNEINCFSKSLLLLPQRASLKRASKAAILIIMLSCELKCFAYQNAPLSGFLLKAHTDRKRFANATRFFDFSKANKTINGMNFFCYCDKILLRIVTQRFSLNSFFCDVSDSFTIGGPIQCVVSYRDQ